MNQLGTGSRYCSVPELGTAQYRNSVPLGTGTRYNWVPRGTEGYREGTEGYRVPVLRDTEWVPETPARALPLDSAT
ncbi:hypothetical protein M5K25_022257 [Dendrobium thyrsiflorum]|uniref:Uncharacterized protein n=1 Tax=Dendrobium thyrsiflorum TaxID=117978 RepID=A0ABD0U5X9_DENTH